MDNFFLKNETRTLLELDKRKTRRITDSEEVTSKPAKKTEKKTPKITFPDEKGQEIKPDQVDKF